MLLENKGMTFDDCEALRSACAVVPTVWRGVTKATVVIGWFLSRHELYDSEWLHFGYVNQSYIFVNSEGIEKASFEV